MPRIQHAFPPTYTHANTPPTSHNLSHKISRCAQVFFFGLLFVGFAAALAENHDVECLQAPSKDQSLWNTFPGKVLTPEGDSGCYLSYGFITPEQCAAKVNDYLNGLARPHPDPNHEDKNVYYRGKGDLALALHPADREGFVKATEYIHEALFQDPEAIQHASPEEIVETLKTSHRILTQHIFDPSIPGEFRTGVVMIPGIPQNKKHSADVLIEEVKHRRDCSDQECRELRAMIIKYFHPGDSFSDVYRRLAPEERDLWHHFFGEFPLPEDISKKMLEMATELKQRANEDEAADLAAWIHQKIVSAQAFSNGNKRIAQAWMHVALESKGIEHIILHDPDHYIRCISQGYRKNPEVFTEYVRYLIRWNQIIDPLHTHPELLEFPDCSTSFSLKEYQTPPLGEVFFSRLKERISARIFARWTLQPGRIFNHEGDSACTFFEKRPRGIRTCNTYIAKAKKGINPGKTKVFLGLDSSQLDDYEKASAFLANLPLEEIAGKIQDAYRLLFQKEEYRSNFLRNIEPDEIKDNSLAEYTAYAQRRGANAMEIETLQAAHSKSYTAFSHEERKVWYHYINRFPPPDEVNPQMEEFANTLQMHLESNFEDNDLIPLAAWCHQEIIRINPCEKLQDSTKFARLIMNAILQHKGYNPVIFPTEHEYFEAMRRDRSLPGDFVVYLANVIQNNFASRFKTFA